MKKWSLIAVMAMFVAIPVVFWAGTVVSGLSLGVYLYGIGRILALVGFVFIFFQYVFSSKIKWIERGIGLDKLFGIHRTSGLIGLTIILIHPIFLILSDLVHGYSLSLPLAKLVGVLSLFVFVLAVGSAVLYRRLDLKYETWKAIHWANYAALPLGFLHSLTIGSDLARQPLRVFWFILAGLYAMVLAHKLWHRFQVRKNPFRVAAVVQETHDTWSLYFEGMDIQYKPGQFLIVQLIRDGRVSEPHPFTLASSPSQDRLSISVKSVGDFTSTIGDTTIKDRAYIDAPYGMFSFLEHDAQDLVFVAGGIGITPFISMLRYMHDEKLDRNVTLIWGNKTDRDIAFRNELEQLAAEMKSLQVVYVMSSQEDWPGERGYVNANLLNKYLAGVKDPQVFVCGPPVMTTKVLQSLSDLGVPKQRLHYERFALR
ncbi:MAG: ferredoxin reductase family protein [Anaerolineae bacterium]|nr:ferredoxin reductase family protein [Anaerolineae bacterium]